MGRETMDFDVVIVGAGAAGLSTACHLKQLAHNNNQELSVCVVEKGSEVGAHIISGAVIESRALDELFPDWKERGAPLTTPVIEDQLYILKNNNRSFKIPSWLTPKTMDNQGNYIASLGKLCRWLAEQAEELGVEIFPGFVASDVLFNDDGSVKGVATGDMGVCQDGGHKDSYMSGIELLAKYTVFSEGCRGHLGKQLIEKFSLDAHSDPQHYAIGIKELWDIDPAIHRPGLVVHGSGWPLSDDTNGGFFLYHTENYQVVVGLIIDLNYKNPWISPFEEFQRMKCHPVFKQYLDGGTRASYGARAIAKGGFNSLPKMTMPGALLVGCDAGTLNFAKIKGTHTAMKSGMLGAKVIFDSISKDDIGGKDLVTFGDEFKSSWLYDDLFRSRNFGAALHKFGIYLGGIFNIVDQNVFSGRIPFTLHDSLEDYSQLNIASDYVEIKYPKPDGVLTFDRSSSVFMSNTNHEENQPIHLKLKDQNIPVEKNLLVWAEPAQRYCPAGVYEILDDGDTQHFQINAQNCIHCKTCDIKDPSQNIQWLAPEGGGGPNYPNM